MVVHHSDGVGQYDSVAPNELPSSQVDILSEKTSVLPVRDLETGDILPTALRTRISIKKWLSYQTSTTIALGVFIPSQIGITAVTIFLIFGCTTAFCVLTASKIHIAVIIATLLFMCYVLYMLSLTAFTEPGFLPRNEQNPVVLIIKMVKAFAEEKREIIRVDFADRPSLNGRHSTRLPIKCNFMSSD